MGLGNGRRGMKSPPLLIAVLLACVFVLGINYWITSSRCVELQNHVMELESRMRRAAAERGAVEMKKNEYEDMLEKQKKQIDTIQALHSSQLQNAISQCNSEKEGLLNNLTDKDSLVQNLQIQISNLHKNLESCRMELKELQESQTRKLAYELAQCSSKIAEVKEQCEERLRKAGLKGTNAVIEEDLEKTKMEAEKPKPTTKQEVKQEKDVEKEEQSKNDIKVEIVTPSKDMKKEAGLSPGNEQSNVVKPKEVEKQPSAAPQEPENQNNPDNVNAEEDNDEPKVGDANDQEINDENEEVERASVVNLDDQQEDDKGKKQNGEKENAESMNYYNGDEANVAEPEAEKQAQLIDNSQNLKEDKLPNGQNKQAADQEAEDNESPV